MTTWAVIATGESLKQAPELVARKVKHLPTVAVSDAFRIAPWAKALVATDRGWWMKTPDAAQFAGERWSPDPHRGPYSRITPLGRITSSTNSGLVALDYCVRRGAKRILLLGIDMRGTHYFGPHVALQNTTPARFDIFKWQFAAYAEHIKDVEIINCNPGSALECFPRMALDEALNVEMAT